MENSQENQGKKNHFRLRAEILKLSVSDEWEDAVNEWEVVRVISKESFEGSRCLCGQEILKECHIRNVATGTRAIVGSSCVRRFGNPEMDRMLDSMVSKKSPLEIYLEEAVAKDPKNKVLSMLVREKFLYRRFKKWVITYPEYSWYLKALEKGRVRTVKGMKKLMSINKKMLDSIDYDYSKQGAKESND